MSTRIWVMAATVALFGINAGWAQRAKPVPAGLEERVKQFFADKQAQARSLAKEENKEQVPEIWDFFAAGKNGDWPSVVSLYRQLRSGAFPSESTKADPRLKTMVWQPVIECYGAYEQCANGAEKYVSLYAREILDSIPRGAIYFGGTDPGRWLPTAFSKSHPKGDPCFVLTQNGLTDGLYLKYVRTMYGDRIVVPTDKDSEAALNEYKDDALQRLKEGKLRPGEDVKENADGKVQISGQVAVVGVRALIAKKIFDANPRKEFYVEESFPLDWMYPHLTPHGLIMKINREPLDQIPDEIVQKDHAYWTRLINEALDKWLAPTTSVETVCDFARRVFDQKEPDPFKPDPTFVSNTHSCKSYSKARSSIAGVYAWRAARAKSPAEKERMEKAADFAFKQALALCPYSAEIVYRYIALLTSQNRNKEALLIAETAANMDTSRTFEALIRELQRRQ
jgi:hypothetical protein